uniref:Myosin VIIBb n=1 Tax=Kryptolebias marmoratus TaxID=37003 RepID=A0A3Q3A3V0_KRYMA
LQYLENFLQRGPRGYNEYCIKRLRRIIANGERKELPCWIELQAASTKKPIEVSVELMNNESVRVHLDSASTSAEICQAVADKIRLKDTYGFSLYIRFFEKLWSLSSCGKHVLDAVSQCEQESRRQDIEEKDALWSLSLRKEVFKPWHDCSLDPVSTDLIYRQLIKGIKNGEYTSEKEDEYVQIAAMHYYVQFGSEIRDSDLKDLFLQKLYINGKPKAEQVKGELVDFARQKWALDFSKFYEVTMMSGPPLPKSRFVVAVNGTGIVFMERREKKLLDIPYVEVKKVNKMRYGRFVSHLHPSKCVEADDMTEKMEYNVEGLRQRSEYAVVQQDVSKQDDPMFLICKRGDLLTVDKDKQESPDEKWIRATNQRTNSSGAVYKANVQFLPTLTKPSDDMMVEMKPFKQKMGAVTNFFSVMSFLCNAGTKDGRQSKRVNREKLWAFSKEPLKQPLLKTLVRNSELSSLACSYMGDYPIKQARSPLELTDQIFGPAMRHEMLQDEIYCQIMRQMTSNGNRMSIERGWQLMWLCTGLFPPSLNLKMHLQNFLESRPRDQLAAICLQRLQTILSKEPRKLPPHPAEVEAIQQDSTEIFYKIHFPNDTNTLRFNIASHLKLASANGYGLFMKRSQKVTSPHFVLSLSSPSTSCSIVQGKSIPLGSVLTNVPCLVFFKRKLWFNVIPGKDKVADLTFHFPQEMRRYLAGYHSCSREDMINLGGLLFRVAVDSDRSQFVMIPRMLNALIPADQITLVSPEEWKKNIISSYNRQSGITVDEAKVAFLRTISSWPTFGSAFFEVKQTCEPDYPNPLWIVINKKGVSYIHPKTKGLLVMRQFSDLLEYSSKGNIFQMTIRTLVGGISFVCESPKVNSCSSHKIHFPSLCSSPLTHLRELICR